MIEILTATTDLLSSAEMLKLIPANKTADLIRQQSLGDIFNCAVVDGVAVGFCMVLLSNANSIYIGISRDFQKKGYGLILATQTINETFKLNDIDSITCQIRFNGASAKLVLMLKFEEVNRDESEIYYELKKENWN